MKIHENRKSFPPQTFYHIRYIVFLLAMVQLNFNLTLACGIPTFLPLIIVCKLQVAHMSFYM